MNGLILFLGESFRLGNQANRNRGSPESYEEQIKACNSHVQFIENIINKFEMNSISVYISSYITQYDDILLSIYETYLIGNCLHPDVIGLNNLFHDTINKIENIDNYDFVLFIRIDLLLKDHFMNIFDPTIDKILFPTICWKLCCNWCGHPRVNDTMLFIPKKYYNYIKDVIIGHELWQLLIDTMNLTYDDLDTMINTFHDSDTFKDYNPLYKIVNREETTILHSEGYIFDKFNKSSFL